MEHSFLFHSHSCERRKFELKNEFCLNGKQRQREAEKRKTKLISFYKSLNFEKAKTCFCPFKTLMLYSCGHKVFSLFSLSFWIKTFMWIRINSIEIEIFFYIICDKFSTKGKMMTLHAFIHNTIPSSRLYVILYCASITTKNASISITLWKNSILDVQHSWKWHFILWSVVCGNGGVHVCVY